MNFDIVLIQEPPMGLRGKNISSGTFTFYKPEPEPLFNDRLARVWLAVNKTAEREKYVLEERNDPSTNPDIQIFDFYEKIWRKEETEEDKQRKEQKEKKKKTNKKQGAEERKHKKEEKTRSRRDSESTRANEGENTIVKTAKMSMYHKTKTKNTKQRRKKAEEGKKKGTKRREEMMKKTETM
jgi:hypothetical protein